MRGGGWRVLRGGRRGSERVVMVVIDIIINRWVFCVCVEGEEECEKKSGRDNKKERRKEVLGGWIEYWSGLESCCREGMIKIIVGS
jgi:hypothetical protein